MSFRIVIVFLSVIYTLVSASPGHAESVTWYVAANATATQDCNNPANPCSNIFFALGGSRSGDTIICLSASAAHSLVIDRSITIDCSSGRVGLAGGGFTPAPDGAQLRSLINVPGGTVRLRGIDVEAAGGDPGIEIQAA